MNKRDFLKTLAAVPFIPLISLEKHLGLPKGLWADFAGGADYIICWYKDTVLDFDFLGFQREIISNEKYRHIHLTVSFKISWIRDWPATIVLSDISALCPVSEQKALQAFRNKWKLKTAGNSWLNKNDKIRLTTGKLKKPGEIQSWEKIRTSGQIIERAS